MLAAKQQIATNPPRLAIEEGEESALAPYAAKARLAQRRQQEEECPFRSAFQRDRDRIIHSKAFRRLAHKTQVFINPAGDHYRTRLTHTLEVSQIARTLARSLRLNEDLTEAIALGHDLGHTPFGHSGERTLQKLRPGLGFRHNQQSLRVVDLLAKEGVGLNLTEEVRDGIVKHSKGRGEIFTQGEQAPKTYEGLLVRVSDLIAYLAHDLDDALRSGLIGPKEVPLELVNIFGLKSSSVIRALVSDLMLNINLRPDGLTMSFSPPMNERLEELRNFLHENVYRNHKLTETITRSNKIVEELYCHFMNDPESLAELYPLAAKFKLEEAVCDFISGMTDRYALDLYQHLFWPKAWPTSDPLDRENF